MLILYSNIFKLSNLRNIAKFNYIKNYSKKPKSELIEIINKYKCAIKIQTVYRKKLSDDMICPITLGELRYPFVCIKTLSKFRYYSLNAFIEYLNKSTDDFKDPFSREVLPEHTICEIIKLIKYYKLNKLISKKNWKKNIALRSEYLTLTNCLNDVLNDIFNEQELTIDFIYSIILPQFIYYFHYLILRHKSSCFSLINSYINCLNFHECENKMYIIDYLKIIIETNHL
jgi:hypothetical protein